MTPYVDMPPPPVACEQVFTPHWNDCGQGYTEWRRDTRGWRRYSPSTGGVYGPAHDWAQLVISGGRVWFARPTSAEIAEYYDSQRGHR